MSVSLVTHLSTGRARRKVPSLTENSALWLRQTAIVDIRVLLGNSSVRSQMLL